MKGYGVLSGRYLKQQRRRSILTVLGIILSVALISALLTMGQALKDNMLTQTIYENGSYHILYSKPDKDLYEHLRGHALIDRVGVWRRAATVTSLADRYNLYLNQLNRDAMELVPLHLTKGRLPASPDELAAEDWILKRMPGQLGLGDSVTLEGPEGKPHVYRLVGILQNEFLNQRGRSGAGYTLLSKDAPAPASKPEMYDSLYVTFKKGVDISAHLEEFAKLGDPFMTNTRLLALMGESKDDGLNRALMVIFGTLVGLVVLSTIAVIYNAFHISVLERIRQFGLLRTIGAAPRQIRHLVFKEASILAGIGIPLGLAIGWGALWLVLWLMVQGGFHILQMDQFHLTFHWWIMGLSMLVGMAAVYIAAWLPARKASRVSPVDAVKGAGSIVRESYRRLRIPSLLALLGIEGRMASNNIRRNRTKFRITTFSIIISVILFIVFHYFTQQAFKMTVDTTENTKIAFQLASYQNLWDEKGNWKGEVAKDIVTKETLNRIAALPGVDQVYGQYSLPPMSVLAPGSMVKQETVRKMPVRLTEKTIKGDAESSLVIPSNFQVYDQARLSKAEHFLTAGTADPAKLDAEGSVLIIQTIRPYNREAKKRELLDLTRYKVGDTLMMSLGANVEDEKTWRRVKIGGILSQSPFDAAYQSEGLTVIVTKKTADSLLEALPVGSRPYGTALIGLQVALTDGADSEPVRTALEQIAADIPGGQLINIVDRQKEQRQFAVQMQIFVYGFLTVIGLIGSLNIINTVQTNLLLRRREIGLLQAVGMTMGQIRKMATAEGVWFGVIGCFWGLLIGCGISYFLFVQLSNVEGIPFRFPWGAAVIAAVFALGVGVLSVQGPLRRMARANLIEELREDA